MFAHTTPVSYAVILHFESHNAPLLLRSDSYLGQRLMKFNRGRRELWNYISRTKYGNFANLFELIAEGPSRVREVFNSRV